ncbi:MAG: DMT family transporter [Betaproteobacteria bacterium]|nr:DMT family transporter [Betaproteobacteria bacterium]
MNHADLARGTLLMCAVVLIWGAFLPVSKVALAYIDPYYFTGLRYGIAAVAFVLLLAGIEGRRALRFEGQARKLYVFGTIGFAGFSILAYEGLRLTRPEHGAMILGLGPVHVAVYQWWHTGHRPRAVTLGCIAVAIVGLGLVVTRGEFSRLYTGGSSLGNLLMLLAGISWTAYTLGAQRFPGWSPVRYTALTSSLAWPSIALITLAATGAGHSAPPAPAGLAEILWPLLYVIFVVSIVAILFWNMAVAKIGPLNASLFAIFAPVVTFMIAVAQGHKLEAVEVLGAALVIGALVANNLYNRRLAAAMGVRA